ncbi:MAG: choice-of-anchor tandem repeat NxxGxxAF-containing protein [Bacillota bacterium]
MGRATVVLGSVAVGGLLALASAAHAETQYTIIAASGQQAPGMAEGTTFAPWVSETAPYVAPGGQVIFHGWAQTPDNSITDGLWIGKPGQIQLLARTAELHAASGLGLPWKFQSFSDLGILDSGQGYFHATTLYSDGRTSSRDWMGQPGSLRAGAGIFPSQINPAGQWVAVGPQIVGYGNVHSPKDSQALLMYEDQAPGTEGHFGFMSAANARISRTGEVTFLNEFVVSQSPTSNTTSTGIWSGVPGNIQLVAKLGGAAPGTPSGAQFTRLDQPQAGDHGLTVFAAELTGTGVTPQNRFGIWAGTPGNVQLVVRNDGPAPDLGPNSRIYLKESGPAWASPAPLPYVETKGSQLAFMGEALTSDGTKVGNGIWAGSPGAIHLIAKPDDPVLGVGDALQIGGIQTGFKLNSAGQVAFIAGLKGQGVDISNDGVLCLADPQNGIQVLLREGQTLALGPDDLRTIGRLGDHPFSLSDTGEVAIELQFADNSWGIVMIAVPEPTSGLALAAGATLLLGRRRRI